jgi:hypothetical protein
LSVCFLPGCLPLIVFSKVVSLSVCFLPGCLPLIVFAQGFLLVLVFKGLSPYFLFLPKVFSLSPGVNLLVFAQGFLLVIVSKGCFLIPSFCPRFAPCRFVFYRLSPVNCFFQGCLLVYLFFTGLSPVNCFFQGCLLVCLFFTGLSPVNCFFQGYLLVSLFFTGCLLLIVKGGYTQFFFDISRGDIPGLH